MEDIAVTDEEINDLMTEFGAQYGMDAEQVKGMAGPDTENYFREDAQTKKVIDVLMDNETIVEPKEEKKDDKEEAEKEDK